MDSLDAGGLERELESSDGRLWNADQFALERGWALDSITFAKFLQEEFNVRGYERMQQLFQLRDRSLKSNVSGTFPEGADINDAFQ